MAIGGSSSSRKVSRSSKGFGEDIEIEILSRLPVKSLCSFMCVSNTWYALIKSNPSFTDLHLQRSDRKTSLVLKRKAVKFNKGVGEYEFAVSLVDDELKQKNLELSLLHGRPCMFKLVEVVGCSNGLVCLRLYENYNDTKFQIVVWNPATKQHKILPQKTLGVCLGFEYFRDMRDYKVVSIVYEKSVNGFRAKVFTASTNCWTESETFFPTPGLESYQAFDERTVNGVMYSSFTVGGRAYPNPDPIMSFDLRDEVFELVTPLPQNTKRISKQFLSWKGSLACIAYVRDKTRPQEVQYFLLTMSSTSGKPNSPMTWVKQQEIFQCRCLILSNRFLLQEDKYLLLNEDFGFKNLGDYILYNLRSHERTKLPQHMWPSEYDYFASYNYTESLVSVGVDV